MLGTKPNISPAARALLKAYNLGFNLALPFLRRNQRLKTGWEERLGASLPPPADIWLQAASGGEAYLALEILRGLDVVGLKALVTTNTKQGREILEQGVTGLKLNVNLRYCPFDKPGLMARFMDCVKPRILVLLETELWPGLLWAARQSKVSVLLANGRVSPKSLKGYLKLKGLFRALGPNEVMAISQDDAGRFKTLFTQSLVTVMPNIKFDSVQKTAQTVAAPALAQYLPPNAPFVVLGSVRMEEEPAVLEIIKELKRGNPQCIIGLYPRHMERVDYWRETLQNAGLDFTLRSRLSSPLTYGAVLLGDTFGELGQAYACAAAAFVGGSLAPLGGQNFLEPLAAGIVPVIGPSFKNFAWAAQGLKQAGLLVVEPNAQGVARALNAVLARENNKDLVKARFGEYLTQNVGGTAMVCERIKQYLTN